VTEDDIRRLAAACDRALSGSAESWLDVERGLGGGQGLIVHCHIGRVGGSIENPREWIARAYRSGEELAFGFGPTQLEALRDLVRALGDFGELEAW
jgi:hypothetical protein